MTKIVVTHSLNNFLLSTHSWWKFTLAASCEYYVFIALFDDLKWKFFFVAQPLWPTIFTICNPHLGPLRIVFITSGLNYYLCWCYYSLPKVWSGIWSVTTTRVGFWTWIWSMRHCGLGQEVAFKILRFSFFFKFDWGSYIIPIAKTASKKIGALILSVKFLSAEVALYLYNSTIRPCMQYYCRTWAGAPRCCLELLDKLQKHNL